jgi:hypothetical protein
MQNLLEKKNIPLIKFFFRLIFFGVIIILVFYVLGSGYVRIFLPAFANEIEMLRPEYDVIDYDIIQIRNIDYLQLMIEINKRPDPNDRLKGKVTRLKGQASSLCIYPIIVISLLLAWPDLGLRNRLKVLILSIPLIFFISCLDYPLIFIGEIESYLEPNKKGIYDFWSHFINNGGRQFLPVIAFMIALAPVYLKKTSQESRISYKAGRNDPCPCGSGKKYKHCCMTAK